MLLRIEFPTKNQQVGISLSLLLCDDDVAVVSIVLLFGLSFLSFNRMNMVLLFGTK